MMIYTVTLNPSLDYCVVVDYFELGKTNRTGAEYLAPGGKGINVSRVLGNLGIESTALGFAAGFTGKELVRRLDGMGVKNSFLMMDEGITRINVKLSNIEGTEINGRGPKVTEEKLQELQERLDALGPGDVLFLSGSIPTSLPDDTYQRILEQLSGRGIRTVVDAAKDLLVKTLPHRPFLIKPNKQELGEIFGVELKAREEVAPYARKLQELGAQNVLVSMAGQGAVLLDAGGVLYDVPAPKGILVNGVGAGDSMVAGFMAGFLEKQDYRHAFCMAVAAGSASAFSQSLASGAEITAVYRQIQQENRITVTAGDGL